jgi:hypothetical protein
LSQEELIEKYREESKINGLLTPNYEGYGIANLPDTFAKILGLPNSRAMKIDSVYETTESCENVIFLLLDGLGYNLILKAEERFSPLDALQNVKDSSLFLPITSVFPSTTSAATTTLHTGLTPKEHGILGYTMYLREIGAIAQMLRFTPIFGRDSLFSIGLDPISFIGSRTLHERFKENGVNSSLYISSWIVDSGLSKISNRGADVFPHLSAADMFVQLRQNLSRGKNGFHFAYYASPDTIAHAKGPFTENYASEINSVFHSLLADVISRVDQKIAKKTALIISADHGLVTVNPNELVDYAKLPDLQRMLKVPPTGDSRAIFLHTKEGQESTVKEYFQQRLDMEAFDSRLLLDQGLFGVGKSNDAVFDRIGNVTAVPKKETIALDNSAIGARGEPYPGRHGGLSENEMIVPLMVRKLA